MVNGAETYKESFLIFSKKIGLCSKNFTMTDLIKSGMSIGTASKLRTHKSDEDLLRFTTDTMLESSRILDKLSRQIADKETLNLTKEFKGLFNDVVFNAILPAGYANLHKKNVTKSVVSRIRKYKTNGNYTLLKLAETGDIATAILKEQSK